MTVVKANSAVPGGYIEKIRIDEWSISNSFHRSVRQQIKEETMRTHRLPMRIRGLSFTASSAHAASSVSQRGSIDTRSE